ncbi:MAG: copper chaperone PCu(A)C [Gammaproteobacteria bacterium]|nr:copper chaperone PCu(A)C [Gammaproteobacteria bacterium]
MIFPSIGRTGIWAGALLSCLCVTTAAAQRVADHVAINDPYIRAVPPVVKTTAAFMQIQNGTDSERFVVDAATPVAAAVELHMHVHDDGVMRMRRIPHIHLPPQRTTSLEPGGLHIMLFNLQRNLQPGDQIPLTLEFDDGSTKTVTAVVRDVQGMMKP